MVSWMQLEYLISMPGHEALPGVEDVDDCDVFPEQSADLHLMTTR